MRTDATKAAMPPCTVGGCEQQQIAKGLCGMHYVRVRRHGDPHTIAKGGPLSRPVADRFWPKVQRGEGCWLWTGACDTYGYGLIRWRQRDRWDKAHRVSWIIASGPIPNGLCVLHKCDNPPCVNPAHLFLGTQADNMHDMKIKGRASNRAHRTLSGHAVELLGASPTGSGKAST